jgi:hypothetical protein
MDCIYLAQDRDQGGSFLAHFAYTKKNNFATQRYGRHVPAATNKHVTIEELLDAVVYQILNMQ